MELHFPLLLDGATGTEIQKRGYDGSISAEEWILSNPEQFAELQAGYLSAGSQIILAPTFGANRVKLEEHHIFGKVGEINKNLAALSQKTAEGKGWVAGDMTTVGKLLYPAGDVRFEELTEIYREQAEALEEAGVDLYVLETLMSLSDARAAILAIRSISRKPIFVTFTCEENGRTMFGSDVAAILQVLQGMEIDAFGLNCSTGPDRMLPHLKRLHEIARLPLIAKPNAGLPEVIDGKTVYLTKGEEFAEYAPKLAEAGVAIFGGCCGTDRSHIEALKGILGQVEIAPPAPQHTELLPCATERELYFLDPEESFDHVLTCGPSLEEELELEAERPGRITAVSITSEDDLIYFEEQQSMIDKALCIVCDDARLLEKALRLYQGRPLYEGSIAEEELLPLVKKYGVII